MNSWMEVLQQWHQFVLYPRWAASAHYGYGEARFVFYPPASWTLGAALGALLPWELVPGAYSWLVLTFSGCSMFLLARRWLPRGDAIFAAALYAANPYYIVVVYWRSANAELLAGALLPLLLLFALRTDEEPGKVVLPLGLIVAAAWLTNAPAAVMVNYSLALLLVVMAIVRRSPRVLLYGAMAIVLGAALAAFYIFPAAYEEKWVNIAEVLSPGVRPQDNFLFTIIPDPDHNRFNWLVSLVALAEMIALAGAALLTSRRPKALKVPGTRSSLRVTLFSWSAVAMLLMFPITFLAWQYLPELRFVQLPWRWLLCLNVAFALLATMAWRRWIMRALICAVMVGVLALVWFRVQAPWWDAAADIALMQNSLVSGEGYQGTDEYVPAGADPYEIKQDARRVTFAGEGQARIHVLAWDPESKRFSAIVSQPGELILRLFNYPAWQVEVNGRRVTAGSQDVTGQMLIPVEAGENLIQVNFSRTWDRTVGGMVSGVTAFLLLGFTMFRRRLGSAAGAAAPRKPMKHVLIATSNPGKLRDFAGAAAAHNIEVAAIPDFSSLPTVVEDGLTFEANARKKAEAYSRSVPGEIVLADDSGLEVDALGGAPGVHSARYAADQPHQAENNTDDEANNARLIRELAPIPADRRTGRFVCVIAAARDGQTLGVFHGKAEGIILDSPRGTNGFGYDPLFYFPQIQKTFAELTAQEKSRYSHRGKAFREFLSWCEAHVGCC
ncbi:MAG: RdgB/HAM1 family non-canonical purine NTP pyrophosphatase [Acidobacteriia bacterium]|nr:RdgB/HAM1 family non-canonical purine NTP pyrophosphatase [Terriglobia bacterium]